MLCCLLRNVGRAPSLVAPRLPKCPSCSFLILSDLVVLAPRGHDAAGCVSAFFFWAAKHRGVETVGTRADYVLVTKVARYKYKYNMVELWRAGHGSFTVSCYQSPLGPLHYQCRAHDTRRPLQKRADTLQFRVLLRENQLDLLSARSGSRSGSDQQCMDERRARYTRLCEEDATLNRLRLAAVVAADNLASATDGCDALDNCSSVCSGVEPNVYWAERARLAAQAGITVDELVKREYEEGIAANAAASALAAQAGLTVEQLDYHSGITGAELKKRLIKGEYDEGMAADAARNARLWDEGMAAYTAPVSV